MRFVIGTIALLVLGSIFGSIAGLLFWPEPFGHRHDYKTRLHVIGRLDC